MRERDDEKPRLPPSLNRRSPAAAKDRAERDARLVLVENAMRKLPRRDPRRWDRIPGLAPVFEDTYRQVQKQKQPATWRTIDGELSKMGQLSGHFLEHIQAMHSDTFEVLIAASGAAGAGEMTRLQLYAFLANVIELAQQAIISHDKTKRPKGGRPPDLLAVAMTKTALFVYKEYTGKKGGRHYDTYGGKERDSVRSTFLHDIFEIYGIKASAIARNRPKRMGKNRG